MQAGRRRRCAPRTSRAASRPRPRCTGDRRRACRGWTRAPRNGARRSGMRTRRSASPNAIARYTAGRTPSIGGVPLCICRSIRHRARRGRGAHAARSDGGARRPRRCRARAHDGRAARRPPRAAAGGARRGGDGRHVALRQPGAVRAGRGLRPLPARRGGRSRVAAAEGADVVFAPGAEVVYPAGLRDERRPRAAGRRARGPLAPRPLPRRRHGRHAPLRARAPAAARSSARRTTSSS